MLLPAGRSLWKVPADGSCFFHCVHATWPETGDLNHLRCLAQCPDGWADEDAIARLAAELDLRIVVHPVALENLEAGLQTAAERVTGSCAATRRIDLVYWTRNGAGLHFDVLAPVREAALAAVESISESNLTATEVECQGVWKRELNSDDAVIELSDDEMGVEPEPGTLGVETSGGYLASGEGEDDEMHVALDAKPSGDDLGPGDGADEDDAVLFHADVKRLIATWRGNGNTQAFLSALPLFLPSVAKLSAESVSRRFAAGAQAWCGLPLSVEAAESTEVPHWRTFPYPRAVLFEALAQSCGTPAVFYVDAFAALLRSILHKNLAVANPPFTTRARYWVAGTAAPGCGKNPALDPLRDILLEVMGELPHLAPGSSRSRCHLQQATTHAAAQDRLTTTGGYLFIATAEGGPLQCPTWPTHGTWDQARFVNYQRLLDAAYGGPVEWETMVDRRAKRTRPAEASPSEDYISSTNVTIFMLQQEVCFRRWWAQAEENHSIGLSARFLFSFADARPPGLPSLGAFASEVAWPFLKAVFAAVLRTAGCDSTLQCKNGCSSAVWPLAEPERRVMHAIRTSCHAIATDGICGRTMASCLVKTPYWVSQLSLYNSVLEQLLPHVLGEAPLPELIPQISKAAFCTAAEFTWLRYLGGIAVLEHEIRQRSWNVSRAQVPLDEAARLATSIGRVLRCSCRRAISPEGVASADRVFRHLSTADTGIHVKEVFSRMEEMGLGRTLSQPLRFQKFAYAALSRSAKHRLRAMAVPVWIFGVPVDDQSDSAVGVWKGHPQGAQCSDSASAGPPCAKSTARDAIESEASTPFVEVITLTGSKPEHSRGSAATAANHTTEEAKWTGASRGYCAAQVLDDGRLLPAAVAGTVRELLRQEGFRARVKVGTRTQSHYTHAAHCQDAPPVP